MSNPSTFVATFVDRTFVANLYRTLCRFVASPPPSPPPLSILAAQPYPPSQQLKTRGSNLRDKSAARISLRRSLRQSLGAQLPFES